MTALLLNWAASASALTAVVLVLRALFGKRVSARLRYALWALVLARLLLPGQFFTAPVETPRVFPQETRTVQTLPGGQRLPGNPLPGGEAEQPVQTIPVSAGEEAGAPSPRRTLRPLAALGGLWLAGTAVLAAVFLVSNLRFFQKLRRVRRPLAADCPLPVYTAAGLPSPCLFGVFRPAVYVTPETAANPVCLRHVLVHEATHYRHGDQLWSLLRCAALAVHWWNPLVWLAAVLSRRDAELACDEGALKVLGDGERRAYGGTLLALVTARPRPGDLLRCATTMTGDKRSLRERVGRIARAPRRWLWAAVLSVVLAALVCACSFAKTAEKHQDGPLTTEELQIFNNKVFNGDGLNMRNQLLFQAVETPEDYKHIDLFELFYNGTGQPMEVTEEERRAVAEAGYGGEDPMVDLIKCPRDEMDAVLREYVGLSLDETDQWCLDRFTYLEEYDAYYDFHGDTNYPGEVAFISGEWKDGKVLLYYEGSGFPGLSSGNGEMNILSSSPACVTLEPQKDGGYHFLSNWYWDWNEDPPVIPTAYPAWEPETVIPLDSLKPYQAPEITVVPVDSDNTSVTTYFRFPPDERSEREFRVMIRHEADGGLSAGVRIPDGKELRFLTVSAEDARGWSEEDGRARIFEDLFGHYGMTISYNGWLNERHYGEFNDYYTFAEDGTPSLLLRAKGEVQAIDLDGDGEDELTSGGGDCSYLFFRRDGQLYQAEVHTLLQEAWPEAGCKNFGFWDREGRFLPCAVEVPMPGTDVTVTAYRDIFFDGENLRIYKNNDPYTGHLARGLEALPADVVRQAALFADTQLHALAADGYGWDGSGNYDEGNAGPGNVAWDDWRLTGLSGPYYETAGDIRVEIWNVSYETHTTTPGRVMLAGGSYMGEEGWCMIGYPGCDYLCFRLEENGERTFLFSLMENDCYPGTELFREDLIRAMAGQGITETLSTEQGEMRRLSAGPTAAGNQEQAESGEDTVSQAVRYYEAGSLPLFEIAFSRLDENAQRNWLERLYADGDISFFSVAARGLDSDSPLITGFTEKSYVDGEIAFFSTLTDCVDETVLESWLDRALADEKWNFQSVLFDKLGWGDDFDSLEDQREKEAEKARRAEYEAAGVTVNGKNYYYQGQLVHIFLDIRANRSFYTLNMNPRGAVNIRITRDANDKITSVSYMTEAEVAELLGDSEPSDL